MATQAEVTRAFARDEPGPNVASNFRRIEGENSTKEYLCGDRNGEGVVLAVREPIGRFKVYRSVPFRQTNMRYGSVRQQARTARRGIRQTLLDLYGDLPDALLHEVHENAPQVDEIDDIEI